MDQLLEAARLRAYRQARVWEPNMDCYSAAMSVYAAAFGGHRGEAAVIVHGERLEPWQLTAPLISPADVCGGCGGPYDFDTSVPSVLWNRIVRAHGGNEYLCTGCVVATFARARQSFTARLSGAGFDGLPIEVRIESKAATDVLEVQSENNRLRREVFELRARLTFFGAMESRPAAADVDPHVGDTTE